MDVKWVTRERAKAERVASPWLVRKFVDPESEFLFVPADRVGEVALARDAIPFETLGVELAHCKEVDGQFPVYDAHYSHCRMRLEGAGGLERSARS